MYIIRWEEQDERGEWKLKAGTTRLYPENLVIGWIAYNAKTATRRFTIIKNPSMDAVSVIPGLPDHIIVQSFYS